MNFKCGSIHATRGQLKIAAACCLGVVVCCTTLCYYVSVYSTLSTAPHHRSQEAVSHLPSSPSYPRPSRGIIYNRVGKCGSRAILLLMRSLSRDNGFKMIAEPNNGKPWKSGTLRQQLEFVTYIDQQMQPFIYSKHLYFTEFERFGSVTPIHINIIRDPLTRLVSNYYFKRFGDSRQHSWDFRGSQESRNMSFDECVLRAKPECVDQSTIFYIIPYFCGHARKCSRPSVWALKQALYNLTRRYLVVGILEEVGDFVKVLEKLLPQFFRGAWHQWENPDDVQSSKRRSTRTRYKRPVSDQVVQIMQAKLRLEYQFYEAVKRQFHSVKRELGIGVQESSGNNHELFNNNQSASY